jgi:hypothetical protein
MRLKLRRPLAEGGNAARKGKGERNDVEEATVRHGIMRD